MTKLRHLVLETPENKHRPFDFTREDAIVIFSRGPSKLQIVQMNGKRWAVSRVNSILDQTTK